MIIRIGGAFLLVCFAFAVYGGISMMLGDEESKPKKTPEVPTLAIPDNMNGSPEALNIVRSNWNNLLRTCPGLVKYQSDFSFLKLLDMTDLPYPDPAVERVDVIFKVSEDPKRIPNSWRAYGHNCQYGISPNGDTLRITKSPCVSLCLGQLFEGSMKHGYFVQLQ